MFDLNKANQDISDLCDMSKRQERTKIEIHNNRGEKIDASMPVYDPITESVYCNGERIYQETGIGEVDLRKVMAGEETFEDGTPFTLEDFLQECLGLAIYP